MHRSTFFMAALIATTASVTLAELKVETFRVSESRIVQVKKLKSDKTFSQSSSLTVQLLISGPEVEAFSHYAQIQPTEARDDSGQSLVRKQSPFGQNQFRELNREQMWFFEDNPPKDQIKIDVNLMAPTRKATKIKVLKGSLQLQSSITKAVTFPAKITKAINDKVLKAAGVVIEITQVNKTKGSIQLKTRDPKKLVHGNLEILDAKGKKISQGYSSFGFNNQRTITLDTNGKLPAGSIVRVLIVESRKTIDVPFELKDIPLP